MVINFFRQSVLISCLVYLGLAGIYFALFRKADKPVWASFIPVYREYIFLRVAGCPGWWLLILIATIWAPVVGYFWAGVICFRLARRFNRGEDFAIACAILPVIFVPFLAFGKSQYNYNAQHNGPAEATAGENSPLPPR